jgi:diacylglycerol O-acyltransferase
VKDATGVKLNDVVLGLCSGALRRWLEDRDALPDTPLVAACPVSTRDESHMGDWGNMVSGMFAGLATHIGDPVERLHAIHAGTDDAKGVYASGIEDAVIDWAEVPVPAAMSLGVRFYDRAGLGGRVPPIFNLLISNVPGPPVPLYAATSQLTGCFPMGPILDSIGLNITVLSYVDRIGFGLVGCPETVPDMWDLADAIPLALEELEGATA